MEEKLRDFLEKFAELERRVRKLAAEDRARQQELGILRDRLRRAEREAAGLRELLAVQQEKEGEVRARLEALIARLEQLKESHRAAAASGPGLPSRE